MFWIKKWLRFLLVLGMLLSFSACSNSSPTALPQPISSASPVKNTTGVIVEGRVVPKTFVNLSFQVSGKVSEILVNEGDQVKKGDVLIRLANRAEVESDVARAELERLNAQQDLDDLFNNHLFERSKALEAVAKANQKVRDAKYQLDNFTVPQNQLALDAIEAVKIMEERLDQARLAFEPYKNDSLINDTRKKLKEALDNAQSDYNAAVRRLNLEVALEATKAELQQALDHWSAIKDGPDPQQLALAKARVNATEKALLAAQARLENLELRATIDGTVAKINTVVGSQVTPNLVVITIADFSSWYVESDNLTELEVVNIAPAQIISIVPDAIPELTLQGQVETVSQVYEEKNGDITYPIKILLLASDSRLRWGMTVLVTFQK
mgnify:CR=1 FL=1